jgi:hypothetical protein
MNANDTRDFDALSAVWQTPSEGEEFSLPRLKARVRRQAMAMRVTIVAEALVALGGAVVGVVTLLNGTSIGVVAGLATLAFTAAATLLAVWARRGLRTDLTQDVAGMIEQTIARTRTGLRVVQATFIVCAIAACYLAIMAVLYASWPSATLQTLRLALWLIAGGLVFLVAVGTGTFAYGRRLRRELERFSDMQRLLGEAG